MILRNSISNTKKFIQKTMVSLKSFLSKGSMYEKLPKTPHFHPFSCGRDPNDIGIETGCRDLDNFYSEFTNQWDSNKASKLKKKGQKMSQESRKTEEFGSHMEIRESMKMSKRMEFNEICSRSVRERRLYSVAGKLKEIMNEGNVDVEEFLYYYSRLTCPSYIDIVDKFFMEMCVEFLGSQPSPLVLAFGDK